MDEEIKTYKSKYRFYGIITISVFIFASVFIFLQAKEIVKSNNKIETEAICTRTDYAYSKFKLIPRGKYDDNSHERIFNNCTLVYTIDDKAYSSVVVSDKIIYGERVNIRVNPNDYHDISIINNYSAFLIISLIVLSYFFTGSIICKRLLKKALVEQKMREELDNPIK